MPPFENLFDKAKNFAKQTSDQTSKAAKVAKLKLNVVSLTSEKKKHLETIGQRVCSLLNQGGAIDSGILKETVADELNQIDHRHDDDTGKNNQCWCIHFHSRLIPFEFE